MRSISPCCSEDSSYTGDTPAVSCGLPKKGRSLKPLLICIGILALTACGSETDSITLGNGLSTQVDTDSTSGAEDSSTTSFLGTAEPQPLEDADTGENAEPDHSTADESEATEQAEVSAGVGGSNADEPLDDAPADIAPGLGAANAADSDAIDLSGDILIPPDAPELDITAAAGELVFGWQTPSTETMAGEYSFDIELYNTETREFANVVRGLDDESRGYRLPVTPHLFNWETSEFVLSICTLDDCLKSFNTPVSELQPDSISQIQSTNTREFDFFGSSLATAANGRVLLAGKPGHDVINENNTSTSDNESIDSAGSVFDSGAAELFFEVENEWFSATELQQSAPGFNSQFGFSVAADSSGDTIVVGAPGDSRERDLAGAAYVFIRAGETWIESAVLAPGLTRAFARFGHSVAISDDGQLIAVGAPGDTNATIDPFAAVDSEIDAGSVTLFRYDETSRDWILSDYLRSPAIAAGQRFGEAIALNESASTLVIAAPGEVSGELRAMPGVVHIFDVQNAGIFNRQQLFQLADRLQDPERSAFGSSVRISADGTTIVASCLNRPQTGGFTNQLNKPQSEVVVYSLTDTSSDDTGNTYIEQHRLTPAGEHGFDTQLSLALSVSGNKIAAGVLNPDFESNTVSVFVLSALQDTSSTWTMVNNFEAPESNMFNFAASLEFNTSGEKLFIGAEQAAEGGRVYIY